MKTTAASPRKSSTRTFPMPLWLQGVVEFFVAALGSYAAMFALMLAISLANGVENASGASDSALIAASSWLLMHGVPLHLNIPVNGVFDAIAGTVSLTPLGLTLVPLAFTFIAGRRLAQASYEGQFWQPVLAGLLTYSALTGVASYFSDTQHVNTPLMQSVLMPLGVALAGTIVGGYYQSRSLARMIGVNAATWVTRFSQYSRWAGSYVWAVVRSAMVGVLAFVAGAAALAAVALLYNWNDVVATYQRLHAGVVGDTAITFLQLGFVPNFLVYAMSWSAGAGFALGEGTSVNFAATDVGVMPALPMLAALPQPVEPLSYFALAVPICAGSIAGWWFFREGENHFDEWLSLKIKFRWISWPLSTLCLALIIGVLAGGAAVVMGAVSHGSLGLGRLTNIGADPMLFAAHTAVLIAIGTVCGSIIAPLVEPDNTGDLERFAQPQKKTTTRGKGFSLWNRGANSKSSAELETPVIDGEIVAADAAETADNPYARLFAEENTVDAVQTPKTVKTADAASAEHQHTVTPDTATDTSGSSQTARGNGVQEETSSTAASEEDAPKSRPIIRRPKAKKHRAATKNRDQHPSPKSLV